MLPLIIKTHTYLFLSWNFIALHNFGYWLQILPYWFLVRAVRVLKENRNGRTKKRVKMTFASLIIKSWQLCIIAAREWMTVMVVLMAQLSQRAEITCYIVIVFVLYYRLKDCCNIAYLSRKSLVYVCWMTLPWYGQSV